MFDLSVGEIMGVLVFGPGADWGDSASESSKNGLVDRGRSGRALAAEPVAEAVVGDRARFRKGLLEPKLIAVGDAWQSDSGQSVSHNGFTEHNEI